MIVKKRYKIVLCFSQTHEDTLIFDNYDDALDTYQTIKMMKVGDELDLKGKQSRMVYRMTEAYQWLRLGKA